MQQSRLPNAPLTGLAVLCFGIIIAAWSRAVGQPLQNGFPGDGLSSTAPDPETLVWSESETHPRASDGLLTLTAPSPIEHDLSQSLRDPSDTQDVSPSAENFGALVLVPDTTVGHYPKHVKLLAHFTDINHTPLLPLGCSGTLIDPYHVITAGHCIYAHDEDGHQIDDFADSVTVIPALNASLPHPYGLAYSTNLWSWSGWTENSDHDHDMGIIRLNRPIGSLTGWRNYNWSTACSFFTSGNWTHIGYPSEANTPYSDGVRMYSRLGAFDGCDVLWPIASNMWFSSRIYKGESGSSAVLNDTVYGVMSFRFDKLLNRSYDAAITLEKFEDIAEIISTFTPSTPDLIPVDINASPTQVTDGSHLEGLDYLIHNYSHAVWTGTVQVRVFLSSDYLIGGADPLLATYVINGPIGPKSSRRLSYSPGPIIPVGTLPGSYFIGITIDIADAHPSNNGTTSYEDFASIVVSPAGLVPPADLSASDGAFGNTLELTWNPAPGADAYDLYRHTTNDYFSSTFIGTSVGNGNTSQEDSDSPNLTPGQVYWYWVTSKKYNPLRTSGPSQADSGYIPKKHRYSGVVTARGLESSKPWAPIEPTTQFYYRDDPGHLCLRIELNDVYKNADYGPLLSVSCEFYRPDNSYYSRWNWSEIEDPRDENRAWWDYYICYISEGRLYERGYRFENWPGRWTYRVYIDDGEGLGPQLVDTKYFDVVETVLTITGRITDKSGIPIGGVRLSGLPGDPLTDSNGNYTVAVDYGWTGMATPGKEGYSFSPVSRLYDKVTTSYVSQDYRGSVTMPTPARQWEYVGTSQFVYNHVAPTGGGGLTDRQRLKIMGLAVDAGGNVYAACSNGNNNGHDGGVTIFKAGGTKIDVDLNALNLKGGVTKLVKAGDGKIYGVQNWMEVNWPYAYDDTPPSRILRINADGTVDVIQEYAPVNRSGGDEWRNRIGGITVGADGNVYWWLGGRSYGDGYYRVHVLWRYELGAPTPVVEEAPINNTNNGWEEETRFLALENVGPGLDGRSYFAIISSLGNHDWRPDGLQWDENRHIVKHGLISSGWNGDPDWCLATVYDPINRKLWAAGRGGNVNQGTDGYGTNIMFRWNGSTANPGLLTEVDSLLDAIGGLESANAWHCNGNDSTGLGNGGEYWVSTLAINPVDGRCWMSWGSDNNYNWLGPYGPVGSIYSVGPNETGPSVKEGRPYAATTFADVFPGDVDNKNFVMGIAMTESRAYCHTVDLENGRFHLFTAKLDFCNDPLADIDGDGDVDHEDYGRWQACYTGVGDPRRAYDSADCLCFDINKDNDVDEGDFAAFQACHSGPSITASPDCD